MCIINIFRTITMRIQTTLASIAADGDIVKPKATYIDEANRLGLFEESARRWINDDHGYIPMVVYNLSETISFLMEQTIQTNQPQRFDDLNDLTVVFTFLTAIGMSNYFIAHCDRFNYNELMLLSLVVQTTFNMLVE
jgi:hypothetical protein